MRSTITIQGADIDTAMRYAEQFEIVANVHITGFTHITRHDGVQCVEIHFEENFDTPSMEPSTELEYINLDDYDDFDGHQDQGEDYTEEW